MLTKEAARESRLKQVERPEYLVLATHGFFRPCDPFVRNPLLNCGAATAGANLRNGDVERFRSELYGLRLRIWRMMDPPPAKKYWVST